MAKRYHQSVRDRMAESRGEERHIMQRHNDGYYEDRIDRRHQEMEDGGMIREDKSAIANMPQEVMYKAYPKNRNYMDGKLDDTIRGVDHQMEVLDGGKRDAGFFPKKV